MYLVLALILVLLVYFFYRKPEYMEDAQTVNSVIASVRAERPELVPIETMYIDPDGSSRFMFFNTDTYAGEVIDFSKRTGVVKNIQGINEKPKLFDYVKI